MNLCESVPPIAEGPHQQLFDFLDKGYFPGTVWVSPEGVAVVQVPRRFHRLLEEIGDPSPCAEGYFVLDPLPRARIWAAKCWDFVFDDDPDARWTAKYERKIVKPTRGFQSKVEMVPLPDLIAAFPDLHRLGNYDNRWTIPIAKVKERITQRFGIKGAHALELNWLVLRDALKE